MKIALFITASLLVASIAHAGKYEVTGKSVVVRKGPAVSEVAVSSLGKGQVVDGTVDGKWLGMQLPNGSKGYVYTGFLKPIAGDSVSVEGSTESGPIEVASPISTTVATRTRLRKDSSERGLVYRYLDQGEPVKVTGGAAGWARVETKWHFESGKPMVGYVRSEDLPQDVVEKVGISSKKKSIEGVHPLVVGGVQPPAPQRVVHIIPEAPKVDAKTLESANATAAQLKAVLAENEKLKAEATRRSGENKAIQAALANANSLLQQSEVERRALAADLKSLEAKHSAVVKQLEDALAGGKNKLLLMGDAGEAIYFKGIGEALMASGDGKTVLRFPLVAANKADKVFTGTKAERRLQGAYAYYIVDTKLLAF